MRSSSGYVVSDLSSVDHFNMPLHDAPIIIQVTSYSIYRYSV